MIPYADFLYFGILLYIAVPTLLIRRWLGFSRVGLARHRGDVARPVRDIATFCLLPSRELWVHRRPRSFRRARRGPDDLGGDGLRHLPVDRGPGFPLDQDAHPAVLALPRGALVTLSP